MSVLATLGHHSTPEPAEPCRRSVRIDVEGLVVKYGSRRAIDGITFQLGNGLVGLLGLNGAGKSTLMRCLAGISRWDEGRVVLDGVNATAQPRAARGRVGFMPERVALSGEFRVAAFLRWAAAAKGLPPRSRDDAVDAVLDLAGLRDVRGRVIANLSKGYRQRVGLAQAILGQPPVVILDEPTAGLDPLNIADVRETLTALAADHLVLFSTHTLSEARLLCERVLVLASGRLLFEGPLAGLPAPARARTVRLRTVGADANLVRDCVVAHGGRVLRASGEEGVVEAVIDTGPSGPSGLVRGLTDSGVAVEAVEPVGDELEAILRNASVPGLQRGTA